MILLIILFIAAIYLAFKINKSDKPEKDNHNDISDYKSDLRIYYTILVATFILFSLVGSLIPLGLSKLYCNNANLEYKHSYNYLEIANLQDNSNMDGNFFLGTGSIDEKMYYSYYYLDNNGFYKYDKIETDDAKIKITDGPARKVTKYSKPINFNWLESALFLPMKKKSIYFEVPKGTIKSNYILDAK